MGPTGTWLYGYVNAAFFNAILVIRSREFRGERGESRNAWGNPKMNRLSSRSKLSGRSSRLREKNYVYVVLEESME